MKVVHVYTGNDDESYFEEVSPAYDDHGRAVPDMLGNVSITLAERTAGSFTDFHVQPIDKQYIFYMTCSVELGMGDGSKVVMEPGDVLIGEDATGHGHTSRVLSSGHCAFVRQTS